MKASDFDKKFDQGDDVSEAVDWSQARRPVREGPDPSGLHMTTADRDHIALKAYVRIVDEWQLSDQEAADLLDVSAETWERIREGEALSLSEDQRQRLSAIIGIYRALHIVFSGPLAETWLPRPNAGEPYSGRRPIDVMIEGGFPAILQVRRHLEALGQGL